MENTHSDIKCQLQSTSKNSTLTNIFNRYDHLCVRYAKKIWSTNKNPAFDRDDITQELRLKLWTAIHTYLERYEEYRETGNLKPMPLEFYLRTAMINRTKDLIKEITAGGVNFSLDDSGLQIGNNAQSISSDGIDIKLGAQSLLDLFDPEDRAIMKLYFLNDFNKVKTVKKVKHRAEFISDTIDDGIETIRKFLSGNSEPVEEFHYFHVES